VFSYRLVVQDGAPVVNTDGYNLYKLVSDDLFVNSHRYLFVAKNNPEPMIPEQGVVVFPGYTEATEKEAQRAGLPHQIKYSH